MDSLQIKVLVENTASCSGLVAEHGLSVWIEKGGRKYLFDTGQGGALATNAGHLGIAVEEADAVFLSHGHYDHTGGLIHVLGKGTSPVVYAHPAALGAKYSLKPDGSVRDIGMPPRVRDMVEAHPDIRWVEGPAEVFPGLALTGPIPRTNSFEDTGGAFFTDARCRTPDALPDDQAAFLDTPGGTVVVLGCAHSGVINTLRYIRELTGMAPIRAVMGGMHLLTAGRERMDKTVEELRELDVRQLFPAHCTGREAAERMMREFPGRCFPFSAGTVLEMGG